MPLGKTSFAK